MNNEQTKPIVTVANAGQVIIPAKTQNAVAKYDENRFVALGEGFVKGITTLPAHYDVVASMKALYLQCVSSPQGNLLEKCTPASIELAVNTVLLNGWQPQKYQCYPVPMGDKLTILPSYHGKQRSAYNNGDVVRGSIKAQVIYKGDTFVDNILIDGRRILKKHEQAPFGERSNEIIGAYAICQKRVGNKTVMDMEVLTMDEIKACWAMSKTDQSTHKRFPAPMAEKTVISRLCKKLFNWTDESVRKFEETGDVNSINYDLTNIENDDNTVYDIDTPAEEMTNENLDDK